MKKYVFTATFLLFVCLTSAYAAETTDVSATGTSQQTQSIVNTGPAVQFNSYPGKNESKVMSAPMAYPGGDLLQPPMIPMDTGGNFKVVINQPFYSAESRYTPEILDALLEQGFDVVQVSKRLKRAPNTKDPIWMLPWLMNEEPIVVLQYNGPVNANSAETEKRIVSHSASFGAIRVCLRIEWLNNVQAVSNGTGSAVTGTAINGGNTAEAATVAPRNAKAESQKFNVPVLLAYCYGPGYVPPITSLLSPPATKSVLVVSLANGFPKDEDLIRIADLICVNRKKISAVTLIGISRDPGINLVTYEAMLKVGLRLREKKCESSCPQQVSDLLQAKVIVGEENVVRFEIQYK